MLIKLSSPETYEHYVVNEGNNKVLYVRMIKALYGMHVKVIIVVLQEISEVY